MIVRVHVCACVRACAHRHTPFLQVRNLHIQQFKLSIQKPEGGNKLYDDTIVRNFIKHSHQLYNDKDNKINLRIIYKSRMTFIVINKYSNE